MTFNTWIFAILLTVSLIIYWLVPHKWRTLVLIVASYFFFSYSFPLYSLLLFFITLIIYYLGVSIRKGYNHNTLMSPRFYFINGVTLSILILAFFKYIKMAVESLNTILGLTSCTIKIPLPNIIVPLGISFLIFGLIHFLVEMYRKEAVIPTLKEFILYTAFFPTIQNGPIKRYPQFMEDVRENTKKFDWGNLRYGFFRIIFGLAKKIIIADSMDPLINPIYNVGKTHPLILIIAIYAYTIKIYFDFSGYSDIAIGISKLFGFKIIENFNYPYLRRNISEFWRNWHISLTSFITEYVYIPLGGSRTTPFKAARNAIIAMGLSGLWHGADWHFVIWGIYHGFGLVIFRIYKNLVNNFKVRLKWFKNLLSNLFITKLTYFVSMLLTFNFVAFGWVLFILPVSQSLIVYNKVFRYLGHIILRIIT